LWIVYMCLCFLQASHSVQSDEEFAFSLQQQELAILNDSRFARNLQVPLALMIMMWLLRCGYSV